MRLLELIGETGSIRRATAGMKMSPRQGWLLLQAFGEPLVATATRGRKGGGAHLTPPGDGVVRRYRSLERAASKAADADVAALERLVASSVSPQKRSKLPRRSAKMRATRK